MSRISDVIYGYEACSALSRHGVDIFAVGDPAGAQLNGAIRRALWQVDDDGKELWGNLLRAASALRWRRMVRPQPNAYSPALLEAVTGVQREVKLLRGFVGDESLLDELASAAVAVGEIDSPTGAELLRSVLEVSAERCVVVASNGRARAELLDWLEPFDVAVVLPSDLGALPREVDQSYVVGPPAFFPSSLLTAPATEAVTFVMPTWFGNRSVPTSAFAAYAEGAIAIRAKVHVMGDTAEQTSNVTLEHDHDTYYPQAAWGRRASEDREPESDEVKAWKVLLGGGLALWLDDGERIRSLDPRQPEGERVNYEAVDDVQPGIYLVLREGATERGAMYAAALTAVGSQAVTIAASQDRWKKALLDRLACDGEKQVIAELKARDVRSAGRVRAWTDPTLICPRRDEDLAALLEWLSLPLQPSYANAVRLRRALYRASADLRYGLEDAVGRADLRALEREGFMRLELQREGFRGMIVAKVLARAPFTEVVPRPQSRLLFRDSGAQWLE